MGDQLDAPRVLTLQEMARFVRLAVLADAEFITLGFLSDPAPQMLTFAEDEKFLREASACSQVSAMITTADLAGGVPPGVGVAISDNPRRDFFRVHNELASQTDFYGHGRPSEVDPSARVHPRAYIASEGVSIGRGVVVEANATIGPGCRLSGDVVVHAGVALGASGFQTCRDPDGFIEMRHSGALVVEEGAHIFSHATIARALFHGVTRIGAESRIGNHAFVSHNVWIGARTFIGHGAVVNGYARIGRNVWIGPGAVLSNGVSVGDGCRVSLGSVVIRHVADGEHVSGNFAVAHKRLLRHIAGLV